MGLGFKKKAAIAAEGFKQYEIADFLGWREGRLSRILTERQGMSRDQARQIKEAIKTLKEKRAA